MPTPDRQFSMQIELPAASDAVWQALTEAREIARWFATEAIVEPRVGGRLVWKWRELHTWSQTIEVLTPGAHLRTRYDSGVDDGRGGRRPLFIDFHLEGHGGTTTLRLVHSGFGPEADFDGEYHGISGGWPTELRSLRLYLARHRGRDRQLAFAACTPSLAADDAWRALTGPHGIGAGDLPRLAEGLPFAMPVPGAPTISGTALHSPGPREFTGIAGSFGDGWLRVSCETWGGVTNVWLWLAGYDQPRERVAIYQRAFDAVLTRVFGNVAATGASA